MIVRGGQRDATDAAMVQLVRLVLDDAWSAPAAAASLRARVPDDAILRRARARVAGALAERPSTVAARAAATLDLALRAGRADHVPEAAAGRGR